MTTEAPGGIDATVFHDPPLTRNRDKADAYDRLLSEDINWLMCQPRTLERDHIEQILGFHRQCGPDLPATVERLRTSQRQMVAALALARDVVCSQSCQSTWKTPADQTHSLTCQAVENAFRAGKRELGG